MKKNIQLVIIDAQNDFCDLPEGYRPTIQGVKYTPSLPVTGAHQDCLRIARLINEGGAGIAAIEAFMDTHQYLDMGHVSFWMDADGNALTEAARITLNDVIEKKYRPRMAGVTEKVMAYFAQLEAAGIESISVWPVHCQIGSFGHNIHADILAACSAWESRQLKPVDYIRKGEDPWSEHYSALQAEVADPEKPSTLLRQASIEKYQSADLVLFAGEASSHCVSKTIWDAVNNLGIECRKKLVVLTDCMSAIPGYEAKTQDTFNNLAAMGLRLATSAEILPELMANK
jgi:nicotinamidase/pyrazinamidase